MRAAYRTCLIRCVIFFAACFNLAHPRAALAVPFDNKPKILLHVRPLTTKNQCTTWGDLTNCQSAVTQGQVGSASGPFYYVYLLVATGPYRGVGLGGNDLGIAGGQFGISYEATSSSGIDIFTWNLCATLEFVSNGWPQSGSGDLVTWDSTNKCQKGEVAIAGYFYCGAYSNDTFRILPRPIDGKAKVADCNSQELALDPSQDLGWASFSTSGDVAGFNPCGSGSSSGSPPDAPATPSVTAGCNQITVSWGAVPTATSYRIYRDGVPLIVVGGSPYIDTNPTTIAARCYRVAAINGNGEGPQSPSAGCTTALSAPEAAGLPTVTSGCGQVTISFASVARATGYRIYRDGVPLAFVGGSPYTDTGAGAGVQRCYRVAGTNGCGEGPQSPQAVCATPGSAPAVPGAPVATAACGQISIAWSAAAGATSYKVYRDGVPIATVGGSPYVDTNPTTISQRCYRVSALNDCGESSQSALASCATALASPAVPATPILAVGCSQISVSWTAVAGATGYKVYRDGVPVATVSVPPFVDTNPTSTSQRCYRVSAFNTCGESAQSAQAACGLAGSAPAAPGTPTATAGCGQISLAWSPVSGASSYKVFRDGIAVAIVGGSPWVDTDPSIGVTRCYRISALSDCGESPQSAQASCAAAGAVPGAPATPTASGGCGVITVNWGAVSGATSYRVYRDGVPVVTVGGAPWVDTNPTTSAPRCYRVSAVNDCGESSQSVQASCATAADLPPAPGTPVATAGCGQISLSWPPVAGAQTYKIYRDGVPLATVGGSPYTDVNPTTSGQRCYRVSAVAACGEGPQSNQASCALAQGPPAQPAELHGTRSCSTFQLGWAGVAGAQGYKIYRDGLPIATITTGALVYEDAGPGAAQRCYRVTAFNGCGEGSPTEPLCVALLKVPHPTSVDPPGGAPGTAVTIRGTDFGDATAGTGVTFTGAGGAQVPAAVSNWSDTEIRCAVPEGAISGGITVLNPCGAATALAWTPIRITDLMAVVVEGGVRLSWRSAGEPDGGRIFVYRRVESGAAMRLNSQPLEPRAQGEYLDNGLSVAGNYAYEVRQLDRLGREVTLAAVSVEYAPGVPVSRIVGVSPNPVRGTAQVDFRVGSDEPVTLAVFDVLGRRLCVLAEGRLGPGNHVANWATGQPGSHSCPPGLYVLRLMVGSTSTSRKVVVSR